MPHPYLWSDDPPEKVDPPLQATTGPDGQFSFTAPRSALGPGSLVMARLPGHGPDWAELGALHGDRTVTLRLAKDDVLIQGRVLDLEGQPVAGVDPRERGRIACYLRLRAWERRGSP